MLCFSNNKITKLIAGLDIKYIENYVYCIIFTAPVYLYIQHVQNA